MVIHHGGAAPGGSSFVLMVPDGGVSAAALTNLGMRSARARSLRRVTYTIVGLFESELAKAN